VNHKYWDSLFLKLFNYVVSILGRLGDWLSEIVSDLSTGHEYILPNSYLLSIHNHFVISFDSVRLQTSAVETAF